MIHVQQCMFSNYNQIKLEINNKKISGKFQNFYKQNNTLLNSTWVKKEIRTKSRKYFELIKNENRTYKNLWDATKEERGGAYL